MFAIISIGKIHHSWKDSRRIAHSQNNFSRDIQFHTRVFVFWLHLHSKETFDYDPFLLLRGFFFISILDSLNFQFCISISRHCFLESSTQMFSNIHLLTGVVTKSISCSIIQLFKHPKICTYMDCPAWKKKLRDAWHFSLRKSSAGRING